MSHHTIRTKEGGTRQTPGNGRCALPAFATGAKSGAEINARLRPSNIIQKASHAIVRQEAGHATAAQRRV